MSVYQKLLKYKIVPVVYFLIFCTVIAIGIWWFIRSGLLPLIKDPDALIAYFETLGVTAYLVIFLLQLFAVVFIPATGGVIVAASAMIFGFFKTFLICSAATFFGSCVSFALSRYLGRPLIELFLNRHKLDKYILSFEKRKNFLLFIMFFFPFFPDDILCYVAGLVDIRWKNFILAAALGRPWGILISCLVGASILSMPSWGYIPSVLSAIVILAISWRYGSAWEKMIVNNVNRHKEQYQKKRDALLERLDQK